MSDPTPQPAPAGAAPPRGTAIRLREVSQTYRGGRSALLALERLSLDVAEREFVCLLGASGCGKTTLLNLIAGIYRLGEGTIDTGGRRVTMMAQEAALFPWLTASENVEMGMRFRNVPARRRRERVHELLHLVHLDAFGDHRPHELSGGMRQRVALARALAQEADVLLMDEPFGSLDATTRDVLHDELERVWRSTALTVLFVTHDVREAVRLGERVVLLSSRPGRVVAEFPVALDRPRRIEDRAAADIVVEVTDRLRQEVRRHGH